MLGIKLNLLVRGLRPTYIIEILYKEDLATSLICICIYACIQWFNLYQYELIYITCIYFILWIRILYYIIYFLAKIIPVLATGDFFRLLAPFCFWHASTFFFFLWAMSYLLVLWSVDDSVCVFLPQDLESAILQVTLVLFIGEQYWTQPRSGSYVFVVISMLLT